MTWGLADCRARPGSGCSAIRFTWAPYDGWCRAHDDRRAEIQRRSLSWHAPSCVSTGCKREPEVVPIVRPSVIASPALHQWRAQMRGAFRMLFRLTDHGTWVAEDEFGCAYPGAERALAALSRRGVRVLVNLHEKPHDPRWLVRYNLSEIHVPVQEVSASSATRSSAV